MKYFKLCVYYIISEHVLNNSSNGMNIISSKLAYDAAVYGGIALAEEFLGVGV